MAAKGYPGTYAKGSVIEGLDAAAHEGVEIFHAGTRQKAAASSRTAAGCSMSRRSARPCARRRRAPTRPSPASTGREAFVATTSAGGQLSVKSSRANNHKDQQRGCRSDARSSCARHPQLPCLWQRPSPGAAQFGGVRSPMPSPNHAARGSSSRATILPRPTSRRHGGRSAAATAKSASG